MPGHITTREIASFFSRPDTWFNTQDPPMYAAEASSVFTRSLYVHLWEETSFIDWCNRPIVITRSPINGNQSLREQIHIYTASPKRNPQTINCANESIVRWSWRSILTCNDLTSEAEGWSHPLWRVNASAYANTHVSRSLRVARSLACTFIAKTMKVKEKIVSLPFGPSSGYNDDAPQGCFNKACGEENIFVTGPAFKSHVHKRNRGKRYVLRLNAKHFPRESTATDN